MTIPVRCSDKDVQLAYLYDEVTPEERAAVEAHVAACVACRRELNGLREVRAHLASWSPPERSPGYRMVRDEPSRMPQRWWRAPARGVGLAAAAVLTLAAGAAVANLEVRYDDHGVTVRTGWRAPAAPEAVTPSPAAPWRADLVALEQRLRLDMAARPAAPVAATDRAAAARGDEAALLRRVSALVEASEQRQQRELALRVAQLVRDVSQQRRADWARIQQGFSRVEDVTSAGVVQQREMLNYLMRVSQRDQR